jgi:lipopolysaccharide transport system ATP-binding protein
MSHTLANAPMVRAAGQGSSPAETVVTVRDLGKCYRIYDQPQDRLKQALRWGRRQYFREFWAVRGVSLDIRRGEMAGIVGRNGSGKSTLLQMICGILTPTTGTLEVQGRVAALLELGAGFNPDFTGRENVFMNGAILGLSREQIVQRYDEIVAFAELEDFIERPVKTYSSGMFVRLAFAVATSCEPDILVVDEALAVGDEAFQRKCFSRLERIRERGGTILFVSHAAGTVLQLCDSAYLLDQGELILSGSPRKVITAYHKLIHAPPERMKQVRQQIVEGTITPPVVAAPHAPIAHAQEPAAPRIGELPLQADFDPHLQSKSCVEYEPCGARIGDAQITTREGRRVNLLLPRREYVLRYRVQFDVPAFGVRFGTMIKSISGNDLGGSATLPADCQHVAAGTQAEVTITFRCLLPPGVYFMNVGLRGTVHQEDIFLHRLVDALAFRVVSDGAQQVQGMFDFLMQPRIDFLPANSETLQRTTGAAA